MNYSTSTQFVNSRRIGIYEPAYQFSSWADDIKNGGQYVSFSSVISDADRNPSQVHAYEIVLLVYGTMVNW